MSNFRCLGLSLAGALVASSLVATPSTSEAAPGRGPGGVGNVYVEGAFTPIFRGDNDALWPGYGGGFDTDGGEPAKDSTTGYDLKSTFGYAFGGTWLVGFSYNTMSSSEKREGSLSGETNVTVSEYGPTVGVLYGGWKLAATYLLSSEWKKTQKETAAGSTTRDEEVTNKDASGFLINVGYNIQVTSWLQLGPSLIYRNVSYGKQTRVDRQDPTLNWNDRAFQTKAVQTDWSPYFTVVARF